MNLPEASKTVNSANPRLCANNPAFFMRIGSPFFGLLDEGASICDLSTPISFAMFATVFFPSEVISMSPI
ncbi:hypothetical protein NY2A_b178L [Paramecium bursaria Chlorella virus NY2A]|uniref:Uncharacterized protein b178L n=1 Tax=Paramecium bursaria Chlorella virus NY2A TaxID=46021 RepID=A7IW53_PBCVN|nr:hypothetical protein NY2A_b178L [Paramecium bursaria Chlorella virus NY2A]ABT14577.1 hypothetical protein NY2A_b178L [Paramecium bursaria Chlorella virus NY2A]